MTHTPDRIALERSHLQAMSSSTIQDLTKAVLDVLGEPLTAIQGTVLSAYQDQNWDEVKRVCLYDPCDPYLACLSCLASAHRSPTIAESTLRDASRWAAQQASVRAAKALSDRFYAILSE